MCGSIECVRQQPVRMMCASVQSCDLHRRRIVGIRRTRRQWCARLRGSPPPYHTKVGTQTARSECGASICIVMKWLLMPPGQRSSAGGNRSDNFRSFRSACGTGHHYWDFSCCVCNRRLQSISQALSRATLLRTASLRFATSDESSACVRVHMQALSADHHSAQ